jgi:threonine dehydratase
MIMKIRAARTRIKNYIVKTELEFSEYLSSQCGCKVYLKLENRQVTNSFKIRGACNKILTTKLSTKNGFVAASSGNHAAAFAYLAQQMGFVGIIFLPVTVPKAKLDALKSYPVQVVQFGYDTLEAEYEAKRFGREKEMPYVSPYNNLSVIQGQGTLGLEIHDQLLNVHTVFIPVGGGGLAAGVGSYFKKARPLTQIIGCQPFNSKVMYESVMAGKILKLKSESTLADGTAGGIEKRAITFPICSRVIDDWVLVKEWEILDAIRIMISYHDMLIEGAAALTVAGLLKRHQDLEDKNVVLIITGERVTKDVLKELA